MGGFEWAAPGEATTDEDGHGEPAQPPAAAQPPGAAEPPAAAQAAPATPPPSPAPAPRRRRRAVALIAGLAVALVALTVAGIVVAGDDDPQERASADGSDDTEDDAGDDDDRATTTASSTTTTRPTTTTEPPWRSITGAGGAFQVQLPPDWRGIDITGDMTGQGTAMFPGDAPHANLAETTLSILPTPQTRFLAMEGDSVPTVEDTDILVVDSGPANVGPQAAYDLALEYTDSPILREGTVTTPAGVVGWFETEPTGLGITGRHYVFVHNGTGWYITYWTGDIDESGGQADRIVGTFAPA